MAAKAGNGRDEDRGADHGGPRSMAWVLGGEEAALSAVGRLPTATYRWQFHGGFRFPDATVLVPYLAELGISHCYASPYLKAHPGSRHGYDISDYNAVNPEIGSDKERQRFVRALRAHGLGQVIDIVPNHMTVNDPNNRWWWDVLEYGETSRYAHYFDIDWDTPEREYQGKVVIPVLGDQYGRVLESGEITLAHDAAPAALVVEYYEHRLPISPWSYPTVLDRLAKAYASMAGSVAEVRAEILDLSRVLTDLKFVHARGVDPEAREAAVEAARQRYRDLFLRHSDLEPALAAVLGFFNGERGEGPERFDALHDLLEEQAYRLAFWRVSGCEINYRRFFDINDLAALRMENSEVFAATHALIGSWVRAGDVSGLRVDHPDGLRDPAQYFARINAWARPLRLEATAAPSGGGPVPDLPLYLVVEKILARDETLPEGWPVHGTTGYDFANLVNGVLVDAQGEQAITRVYETFIEARDHYPDMLYECKKLIMHTSLASEIHNLGIRLERIAERDRRTRDYTRSAQMAALFEIVACFPVYRTYVSEHGVDARDRHSIETACAQAKERNALLEPSVVEFVQRVLLLEGLDDEPGDTRREVLDCVAAFQQYTGPVMAKGLEDTLFYRYNRFVSLNEVGGDPSCFGVSVEAFHKANSERLRGWPHAMLCTSSHDTKRSEDVRSRLNVLAEMPDAWSDRVLRLRDQHQRLKGPGGAPSYRDEYLFYQSLLGIWPLGPTDDEQMVQLCARLVAYMEKAAREAKLATSWVNPYSDYERGLTAFIEAVLDPVQNPGFREAWSAWVAPIARVGLWTGLSQLALKLLVPGVPDFYQGTEVWDFSLVDPDNRRPVDYSYRLALMADIAQYDTAMPAERSAWLQGLCAGPEDGRIKMFLTRTLLGLRRTHPDLFDHGAYLPLAVTGAGASHLIGFAREIPGQWLIVVAPRCYWAITKGAERLPLGTEAWGDTAVVFPAQSVGARLVDVFTGEPLAPAGPAGRVLAADLFWTFPIAVLMSP